jgi:hypothetical protein
MAQRQRLTLQKSRRRDPRAYDYGKYMLTDADTHAVVYGSVAGRIGASLEDIEEYLTSDARSA